MRLFLLSLHMFFLFAASAQSSTKIKLDETTIVKDSSGIQYPYAIWSKLMQTGFYSLKPVNPLHLNDGMLLIRLTDEQIKRRDENAPKPKESVFFKTGKTFPDFKLKDINGKKFHLKELKGKLVVINFWFINCAPCKVEIPGLNKLVDDFKNEEIVFLAVALDQFDELKDFLKATTFNYHIVDDGRWFARQHGVASYPTHVVLDREGKIVFHTSGLSTGTIPWLKKSIQALLADKTEAGAQME